MHWFLPNQVNGSQIRPSGWNNILGGRWWFCIVFNRCISWIYVMEWGLWIGLIGVSHAKWRRHKSTSDLQNKITKWKTMKKKMNIHWVISVFVSGCFENIKESFYVSERKVLLLQKNIWPHDPRNPKKMN